MRGILFDKTPATNWTVIWYQDLSIAVHEHIDACTADNGPVRVLPGSHRAGRLTSDAIEHWKATTEPVTCVIARGGLLAFRPLLLHASSPARHPAHRRVVHFELAAEPLPSGLAWHGRW